PGSARHTTSPRTDLLRPGTRRAPCLRMGGTRPVRRSSRPAAGRARMRPLNNGWRQPLAGMVELARTLSHDYGMQGARVTVLVDRAVQDTAIHQRVRAALDGARDQTLVLHGSGDLSSVLALADRLAGAELVIGLGGGSVLDQAKLATLMGAG